MIMTEHTHIKLTAQAHTSLHLHLRFNLLLPPSSSLFISLKLVRNSNRAKVPLVRLRPLRMPPPLPPRPRRPRRSPFLLLFTLLLSCPPPTSTSVPGSIPCVDRGAIDSSDVPPGLADSPFGWLLLCDDDRDDGHGRAADHGDTRTCMSPSPVGAPGPSALCTHMSHRPTTLHEHADA